MNPTLESSSAVATAVEELLPHLAWAPHSSYHHGEAVRLLQSLGVDDPNAVLAEFEEICSQPPQEGSPK